MFFKQIIILNVLFLPIFGEEIPRPIVGIEMDESGGMHRELIYTVQFDYPLAGKDCEYILEQFLPSAVYVSTDQLDDLQRLKKIDALYPKYVDIESPTEKSEPFIVLIRGIPKITETIKLPIHFRYHEPNDKRKFAIVQISTPAMYMNCPGATNELIEYDLLLQNDEEYCQNELENNILQKYIPTNKVYDNEDDDDDDDDDIGGARNTNYKADLCNWKLMRVDYQLKTPLRAKIPVGNAKQYPTVLYLTIILSWIVSIWTVFRTQDGPRRLNLKLNEQRILQAKISREK